MIKIEESPTGDNLLWDIWMSTLHLAAVTVADEIKLFEQLKDRNLTFQEISEILQLESKAIKTLGELLMALGFLIPQDDKVQLSHTSKIYLLSDSPYYWGALLNKLRSRNDHKRLLNAMLNKDSLLTHNGKSYSNMWEQGCISPEAAAQFTEEMHATIFAPAVTAIKTDLFENTKQLLDVGGGSGCFSITFTHEYPDSKATVFELPEVAQISQKYIQKFKAEKNVLIHKGNFFNESDWPKEHDGILLSQILHDWPIPICEQILGFAYRSLPTGGKIFIYEMLLEDQRISPLTTACFNTLMFINHRSQQFSSQEITHLLQKIGFTDIIVEPTFGYFSLIVGKKSNSP
ncbi:MAG TPA: methyltransferase [Gammaproteobacteria bacterium]|nr:methyltransferase [Gammaproteobacteria bacterium]